MHFARSLLVALALAGFASAPPHPQPAQQRTTYVIVHGAWGGGWDWRGVDSLLVANGHRVYRPDLTGLGKRSHLISPDIGLETHIQDVVNEILWDELDDVVLVGHSYGGMVITGVADRVADRLRRLVYVDAFVPESGESVVELLGARADGLLEATVRDGLIVPVWESADAPVPKDVPHPLRSFTDSLVLSGDGDAVPALYILTAEPERLPDDFQPFADRAAARGWQVVTLEAGHTPERSHPVELTQLLLGAARE